MSNLEKAKEIIKTFYSVADCGIFDSRNILGDSMVTVYADETLAEKAKQIPWEDVIAIRVSAL